MCGDSIFVEENKYCQRSNRQISPYQRWDIHTQLSLHIQWYFFQLQV